MQVVEYLLDGLIGTTVWAYLDDITIWSDSFENHVRDIRQVCERLQDHHITAFPIQMQFLHRYATPVRTCYRRSRNTCRS